MNARTILYVEDNEVNRKIGRDLLRRTSYRLIEAHDVRCIVALARKLLIALWRSLEFGVVPEGARLKKA